MKPRSGDFPTRFKLEEWMKSSISGSRDLLKPALNILRLIGTLLVVLFAFHVSAQTPTPARPLAPDDLFRIRRVGATAWSPDGLFATIEFSKESRWLDGVPTNISLLDVKTPSLRALSPKSSAYVGFFNAVQIDIVKTARSISLTK